MNVYVGMYVCMYVDTMHACINCSLMYCIHAPFPSSLPYESVSGIEVFLGNTKTKH